VSRRHGSNGIDNARMGTLQEIAVVSAAIRKRRAAGNRCGYPFAHSKRHDLVGIAVHDNRGTPIDGAFASVSK